MMTVLSHNRWTADGVVDAAALAPHVEAGVARPIAEVLVRRGFATPAEAREFYKTAPGQLHDPLLLPDMDRAVARVNQAIAAGEAVAVYGDYDADGVLSTAVLTLGLNRLGLRVTPLVPHRMTDGYDFKPANVAQVVATGATLLLTVDCGVTAVDAVAEAARAGLDVVVLDHHKPKATLPQCTALVDPHLPGSRYPHPDICGAMLAFKLMWALWRDRKQAARVPNLRKEDLLEFNELAAIATVTDAMPLTGENRALVRLALERLSEEGARNVGVAALLASARAGTVPGPVKARDFSHGIGPRLNAVGRMGAAHRALQLLIADDPRVAKGLTDVANRENELRKKAEAAVLQAAVDQLDDANEDAVIVIAGDDWHPGVIGPVASRLVEKYGRPAIVLAFEGPDGATAKGSGRAPAGFDLHAILAGAAEHTVRFGGHAQACGLEVRRDQLDAFRAAVQAAGEAVAPIEGPHAAFTVEAWCQADEVNEQLIALLDRMEPFGKANPAPVFGLKRLHVREAKQLAAGTLRGRFTGPGAEQGIEFIGFGLAEHYPANWISGREVTAIGHVERDSRTGRVSFRIVDLRLAA